MQMGRPISHCGVEVDGTVVRGKHMISLAREALGDSSNKDTDKPDHIRYIKRVPIGPILVISHGITHALLAGNTVILKPSPQTPLCGEHFLDAYTRAGLPPNVLQVLHLDPGLVDKAIRDDRIGFVMFTGSVENGHKVISAASESFKGVGVELGGKDPAYVREDADLEKTVDGLCDGVFFNAGQSCCSVERIYVDASIHDKFVEKFVEKAKTYKMGNPSDPTTTLGPVVSRRSADFIRKQLKEAVEAGATPLIPRDLFAHIDDDSNYILPQVLTNVTHKMSLMTQETFGPIIGIMPVTSESQAINLMNDSPFGLTASIWTKNRQDFERLVGQVDAGTVYMNNADNLDPALAWSGWKDSGRGISLSRFGFDSFTRTKSVNVRVF